MPAGAEGSSEVVALRGMLPEELGAPLGAWGEPRFRAKEIFRWFHRKGVADPRAMTTLPAALRERLFTAVGSEAADVAGVHASDDRTRKLVVRYRDGATVETVIFPSASKTAARGHLTQCVSTQVGCAMGCVFCHSGLAGLERNLSADEIVAQIRLARTAFEPEERLRNVVFMGMGEPLHNYEALARALRLLLHPEGFALSGRRITVSTVGLVPEIGRLGEDFGGEVGLAVSLHAPDDSARAPIVPVTRKYPLGALIGALEKYPLPPRRRITIEYTLIASVNDSLDQARSLARLLRPLRVKVNLIPLNRHGDTDLLPPESGAVLAFQEELAQAGYSVFIRRRRGGDIAAACGQLALLGGRRVRPVGSGRPPASMLR